MVVITYWEGCHDWKKGTLRKEFSFQGQFQKCCWELFEADRLEAVGLTVIGSHRHWVSPSLGLTVIGSHCHWVWSHSHWVSLSLGLHGSLDHLLF